MTDTHTPAPAYVLVPGAGGAAWVWHRLVAELERRGRTAVAVDLPAADDEAGLAAYADAVVAAAAGLPRVVLVALSMGGLTAPLVCDRLPVVALVLVNAMVPRPGETGGDWWTATGHAEAYAGAARADGRTPDGFEDFFHDAPDDVRADALAHEEAQQSDRPFTEPWPLAAWPDVPTVVLAGRDERFFPAAFQRDVARERLGLDVEELPGGHLLPLTRPGELADRLEALQV
jgi:pimeloyl-ACP methyl ester carboxylesterase